MLRFLAFLAMLVFFASVGFVGSLKGQAAPPSVAGDYAGTLGKMHLRLHIHQDSLGKLTGTLDSVDEGDNALLCDHFVRSGPKFSFSVPSLEGTYEGDTSFDGAVIRGLWKQENSTPLTFIREVQPTARSLRGPLTEIDAVISTAFAKDHIGSVTVGIVSGNQLIWTKSYGDADMEKHRQANEDTVYRVGSITKMFTAVMLEQLADTGTVHLSDPVNRFFPAVDTVQNRFSDAVPITLFQLATHTSGLDEEPDDEETYEKGPVSDWEKILISALPHVHYISEPGTKFEYSNVGYAILGAALEHAAGQPYLEYLPKRIFMPLGMLHTTLEFSPVLENHLAKGYVIENGKLDVETPVLERSGRGYKVPNGAIYTTVGDLAKFASFLLGNGPDGVLQFTSVERYINGLVVPGNAQLTQGYGLGFEVTRRDRYTALGHNGGVAGYKAALYLNRDKHLGVIVLCNALGKGSVSPNDLALSSLDILTNGVLEKH
jgi:CubicO group peptidase (beta-lactamase class C family)